MCCPLCIHEDSYVCVLLLLLSVADWRRVGAVSAAAVFFARAANAACTLHTHTMYFRYAGYAVVDERHVMPLVGTEREVGSGRSRATQCA